MLKHLPRNTKTRTIQTHHHQKQVLGHHVRTDVKFLTPLSFNGKRIRQFQYTTINYATRIRVLKIYPKHSQQNAIDFVDYVLSKFPFHIQTIRTDTGHEFKDKFHWHLEEHVEDLEIQHVYIKPLTSRLNGKVG